MKPQAYELREIRKNPRMWARLALMDVEELREVHRRCWRTVAILNAPMRGHRGAATHRRFWIGDYKQQRVAWALMDAASVALSIALKQITAAQRAQWKGVPEGFDHTYRPSFDFPNQPLEVAS